ncbi:MAG: outer membrane beta-barrel protein [Bacteroidales bacterium]|nr:outer membrane beta-barrel protein [Bacteroidales bacterium]MCM1146363.1 outer membrane beta-barrel protein [Bacteroidales bacterium]MCM1205199.1 outer membrane beta-barrel protein [Bacillota bacterium]MCM1509716.1 outer membrane beta-barrel protein [Clostridium sp.]
MARVIISILILCCWSTVLQAQLITKSFHRVPLPEALKTINGMSANYKVFFIYDELEDFSVTADIRNKTVPDAVREVVGFYPMTVKYTDSIISVECIRKEHSKLIGHIVDEHGDAVEFANVALLSPADSTYITGGVTNANGDFVIPCSISCVLAKVSFVGYKTKYVRYSSMGKVGTIRLTPDAIMLGKVTVKSSLPKTQLKNNAMVTNVSGTILEKAGTAEDVLGQIPMVEASEGNVEVFGRGAAEVYVNGRKLQDNTELSQIISENVQNVEVVNNPGARYSASTKAVIRIRTKRPQGEGLGFTETAEVRNNRGKYGFREQVDLNYRHGGLDISGRIQGKKNSETNHFSNIIDTYLADHWHQEAHTKVTNTDSRFLAMVQGNYILNDSNSLGMRYEYSRTPRKHRDGVFSSELYQDGLVVENNESLIAYRGNGYTHSMNAYYSGKMGKWEVDFNADGLWSGTAGHTDSDENTQSATDEDLRNVNTENISRNRLLAAKLVVGRSVLGGSLSLGAEISASTSDNGHTDESGFTINDKSKISERIYSGFAEYRRRIGRFDAMAGLRYEHVNSNYYLYGVLQPEQSRSYADLFPSASLSTNLGKVYMQLSYSNDIRRPAYSDLTSAVTYINRYTYEGGNPHLRSVYTRNVIINASYSYWLLSAGYKHIKDDVMHFFRPYDNNPAIAYSYPDNANPYDQFFVMLSASPTIGRIWTPRLSAMIQCQNYIAETPDGPVRFDRPQFSLKWNNTVVLPWKLRFEAKFYLQTCGDNITARMRRCLIDTSASLRRDFLNDRLSVQVKVADPFCLMRLEGDTYSASHVFRYRNNDAYCKVSLRAVYKFNTAHDKYKGKGAGNAEKSRL